MKVHTFCFHCFRYQLFVISLVEKIRFKGGVHMPFWSYIIIGALVALVVIIYQKRNKNDE